MRRPLLPGALLAALSIAFGSLSAAEAGDLCLRLDTASGPITLELTRAAAPGAIAALERLAAGPIYDSDVVPHPEAARSTGYFDGLAFDFTRPHLEIRLAAREPAAAFTVPMEIDAAALGLDLQRVADAGEAMNLLQLELLPAIQRPNSTRRSTPTLEEWSRRFAASGYDASFLVGKSRRELFEAIGYRYTAGLASMPARRGAVALVPVSPTESVLSLAILLDDHPIRTGRWMIVGHVTQGLEVAESISLAPHAVPQAKDYRPLMPTIVRNAEIVTDCPLTSRGGPP